MSLSKAVIMGRVVRSPEKRFTSNNIAITSFTIDISNNDQESLIRIITKGKLAEVTADKVQKDSVVVVEGRLQTNTVKGSNGTEKKIVEIDAQAVEVAGESTPSTKAQTSDESYDYEEVSTDDLIGEDEIPF